MRSLMIKQFTADVFRRQPAIVYRLVSKGEKVEIVHDRYPDVQIIIVGVQREVKDESSN